MDRESLFLLDYVIEPQATTKKVNELIEAGADINYQDTDGYTPLMLSLDAQNERLAEYLLAYGANPFLKNKHDKSAKSMVSRISSMFTLIKGYELLFATQHCDLVTITSLLRADISIINFHGQEGYTPLLIAIEQGSIEIVKFLLSQGADITLTCDDGRGVFELVGEEDTPMQEVLSNEFSYYEENSSSSINHANNRYQYFSASIKAEANEKANKREFN